MMNGWGGLWMGVGMVIFWGGLIGLIAFAVRGGQNTATGDGPRRPEAQQILEERFARGEISEDELQARRQVLARRTR